MRLFYTDHFELPLTEGHRFPMDKYRLLRHRLEESEWAKNCELLVPSAATSAQLLLVHTDDYVSRVTRGRLTDKEIRRIGFPWSPLLVERSRRSTGATIASGRAALEYGIGVNLAGGTHHAFAEHGEGFCVFNDVAVAIRVLQAEGVITRAIVVDCDVHQGNGTADIFQGDASVTTFSIHGMKNYPLRKPQSDLDIALPDGTRDDVYLEHLAGALDRIFNRRCDLVFYLAGADPFEGDRLGRLSLSKQGLRSRDCLVMEQCRERRLPLAVVMAGGYAENVNDIVDIHAATIQVACDTYRS